MTVMTRYKILVAAQVRIPTFGDLGLGLGLLKFVIHSQSSVTIHWLINMKAYQPNPTDWDSGLVNDNTWI